MSSHSQDAPPDAIYRRVRRTLRPLRRGLSELRDRVEERRDPVLGWWRSAQRRHNAPPDIWDRVWDNRRRLVKSLAPGKSFADIGGMYGVSGELAFVAEESGASRVVLFDAMDPSDDFVDRHARTNSGIEFYQGDLHDAPAVEALGTFDVVWCSGVLYHSPNPLLQLMLLRRLTKETMVLGNLVIPELPNFEQACLFYPGISTRSQETFAKKLGGKERFPGMASPFDTLENFAFGNMWWGFSPSALRSMMRFTGLDCVEEYQYTPGALDIVAKPGGVSLAIYPPADFYTDRARARHADESIDAVPRYAQAQMKLLRGEQTP